MYARPTLVKLWWSNALFFFRIKQIQISYIHLSRRMDFFTSFLWNSSSILIWDKSSLCSKSENQI